MTNHERPPRTRRAVLAAGLSAALVGVGLLAGCGNASTPPGPGAAGADQPKAASRESSAATSGAPASSAAVTSSASAATKAPALSGTVTYMTWGSPQAIVERKQFCDDFDKEHPGVTCTFILTPSNYMDKLLTMIAGNDAPDVFFAQPTDLPTLTAKNILRPIDPFIGQDHYDLSDFVPAALKQYQLDGKTYGLPRGFGMEAVLYNVDLFQKAGVAAVPTDWKDTNWTFSALQAAAQRLTSGSGSSQVFGYIVDTNNSREWMSYIWSNGGEVFSSDYQQCLLDQQPAVDTLQFLQDLIAKYKVAPTTAVMQDTGVMNMFDTGHIGMAISEPFTFAQRRKEAKFTWDVGVTPAGQKGRIPGAGGVGWAMYARPAAPDLAWQVLSELAGAKFQSAEIKDGTTTPPRLSVLRSGAFLDTTQPPAHASIFLDEGAFVRTDPQPPNWPEINTALQKQLSYLWTGERNAQTVAKAAVEAVNPLLAKPIV